MESETLRAEHDRILATLSVRKSTWHIACAWVFALVALMALGLVLLLHVHDSPRRWLFSGAVAFAVLTALGALAFLVRGMRLRVDERERYSRLLRLRKELGLDDPLRYLPLGDSRE